MDWSGGAGDRIAPLIQEMGRARAAGMQARGQIWGNTLGSIGQLIAQAPERKAQQQEQQARMLEAQDRQEDRQLRMQDRQQSQQASQALAEAINDPANQGDPEKVYAVVARQYPDAAQKYLTLATTHRESLEKLRTMKGTQHQLVADMLAGIDPNDTDGLQAGLGLLSQQGVDVNAYAEMLDKLGPAQGIQQIVATAPENAKAARTAKNAKPTYEKVDTIGPDGKPVTQFVTPTANASYPKPPPAPTAASGFTLPPGGRRYDSTGQLIATAPERPAASGGQGGRAVTSGDANRIAELNNSLKDLATLSATLQGAGVKDATGTQAQIGAALPNFVTNATGWGTTAKEKQAVIDRVKQVIGKALEGGVLRKEDEYKYSKILPTIGDAPEIVAAKLNGLTQAIGQKRDEQMSALEDAGYDTSRFRSRADAEDKGPPGLTISVKAPDGNTYTFPTQAQADVFKKRAGIK